MDFSVWSRDYNDGADKDEDGQIQTSGNSDISHCISQLERYENADNDMDTQSQGTKGTSRKRDCDGLDNSGSDTRDRPNIHKRRYDSNSNNEAYESDSTLEPFQRQRNRRYTKKDSRQIETDRSSNINLFDGGPKIVVLKCPDVNLASANPIHVARAINEIAPGHVSKISKVVGGIAVQCFTATQARKLKGISQLGKWVVSADFPKGAIQSKGVISGISLEVSEKEIVECCSKDYNVIEARRLMRRVGGKLEKSLSVCLTFGTTVLPSELCIGYQVYKVRVFVPPVMRCFKCQRLGHVADQCRGKKRCVRCGGEHEYEKCENKERPTCCRCGGLHSAAYEGCEEIKTHRQIHHTKVTLNISYAEATKKVHSQQSQNIHVSYSEAAKKTQNQQSQYVVRNDGPNRNIEKNYVNQGIDKITQNNNDKQSKVVTVDAFTQTECAQETQTGNSEDIGIHGIQVGTALAKLMLGTIQISRSERFKTKIEIEYAMKDLFGKSFNRDLAGKPAKNKSQSSKPGSQDKGHEKQIAGENINKSSVSQDKTVEVVTCMPPPSTPTRVQVSCPRGRADKSEDDMT
jgi:hypothetical protein